MLARGDRHMDVATFFGINQARISEIKLGKRTGRKFKHVSPAPDEALPPPGPYVVVSARGYDELELKAAAHQELIRQIESLLSAVRGKV